MDKLIINLAPTGIRTTKEMNIHVPMTPDEIISDVYECYKLGVQIVHIHVKDENENNTSDPLVYEKVILGIRNICPNIIICASLSGRVENTFESRSAVLNLKGIAKPDMGSLTLSSLNFTDGASVNSPEMIIKLLNKMNENNIKPELEVFDAGMVNYSKYLIKKGLIKPPYYYNILCGNLSSSQANLIDIESIISALPENSIYTLAGLGNNQLKMNIYGILNGNGVRVGLEDNIYFSNKTLATNKQLVQRIIDFSNLYNKKLATCTEVRELLQININNNMENNSKIIKWVPNKSIDSDIVNSKINKCIESGAFSNFGNNVIALQEKIKTMLQIDKNMEVIMTCNGSCALNALVSLYNKIYQKHLKFAIQSFTFPSSNQGALCDSIVVDIDNNMELSLIKLEKIKDEYDGMIVTNCFGTCVDIQKYVDFAKQYNKILLFDNAGSPYTFYNGKNICDYGNGSIISFHHTKPLGFGEGGAIIINSKYKEQVEKIISFGYGNITNILKQYDIYSSNYKMSEISAIYLDQWLKKNNFDRIKNTHIELYKYFKKKIENIKNITLFKSYSDNNSIMSTIPIIFNNEVNIQIFIENNIEAKKYYYPLNGECPNSQYIYDHIICLPLNFTLTFEDIDKYIKIIINVIQ